MSIRTCVSRVVGLAAVGVVAYAGTALANHTHPDVSDANPFHDEIAWLTDPNHQIASGFPNGTFKPQDPVKRQQLAFWMANFSDEFEIVETTTVIPDPSISTSATATATCPIGKRVLSGGGRSSFTDAYIYESWADTPFTWRVSVKNSSNSVLPPGILVTAQALCGPEVATPDL